MKRKVWILAGKAFGKGLLSPAIRIVEMAKAALQDGHEVHVAALSPESNPLPDAVNLHDLATLDLDKIRPGDGLILGPYLPASIAWKLLRSDLPFHLDLYCVTATEQMALWARTPGRLRDIERAKLRQRYLLHAMRAETIQVSCIEQWMVVAGMFLSESDWARGGLTDQLTRRVVAVPMGVREEVFPIGAPNPYPTSIQTDPVFLWGGSLWNWFDLETLVEAFGILSERGSKARLFFLSGSNRTERSSENDPVEKVEALAKSLGLLGKSIFFNTGSVSPDNLAPWLEHCRAGILANPNSLEALSSWRTRYLDLLWAGKPLVVAGSDPLGTRMVDAGCALRVAAGSRADLADAIERLAGDASAAIEMGAKAAGLAGELGWRRNLSPFLEALSDPDAFRWAGIRPGIRDAVRYLVG